MSYSYLFDLEKGLPFADEEYEKMKKAGPISSQRERITDVLEDGGGFDTPDIWDPFPHPR